MLFLVLHPTNTLKAVCFAQHLSLEQVLRFNFFGQTFKTSGTVVTASNNSSSPVSLTSGLYLLLLTEHLTQE